jgi:hypothetical protein
MTDFLFIPHLELVAQPELAPTLLELEGCELTLDKDGLIIEPNSRAHIRACLFNVTMFKGRWEDPIEV